MAIRRLWLLVAWPLAYVLDTVIWWLGSDSWYQLRCTSRERWREAWNRKVPTSQGETRMKNILAAILVLCVGVCIGQRFSRPVPAIFRQHIQSKTYTIGTPEDPHPVHFNKRFFAGDGWHSGSFRVEMAELQYMFVIGTDSNLYHIERVACPYRRSEAHHIMYRWIMNTNQIVDSSQLSTERAVTR